jgi:hypothetical protein
VRLSPKSVFFGLVALGLPFAVTVGWTLADRAVTTPPVVAAPAGAGVIGSAPAPAVSSEPVTPVDYGNRPPRATAVRPSASASAPAALTPSSSAAGGLPSVSLSPLPPLTDPPVPTPTTVTSEPPSPSATPPASAAPEPAGIELIRRR